MLLAIMLYWIRSCVLPGRFMPVAVANDDATPELSRMRTLWVGLLAFVLTSAASLPPSAYGPRPDSKLVFEITVSPGAWHTGSAAQSLSAQSVAPSPSLSTPSVHDLSGVGPPA